MSAGPTDKATAEQAWRAFKRRHPGTATLDIILPDLAGIARGKRLSVGAFEGAIAGLTFASSIYGIDACGVNVDASGLIWEEGDADRPCLVDWTTLAPVPWRDGGAQVLAGLGEHGAARSSPIRAPFLQGWPDGSPRSGYRRSARSSSSSICCGSRLGGALPGRCVSCPTPRPVRSTGCSRWRTARRSCLGSPTSAPPRTCLQKARCPSTRPDQFEVNLGHLPDPVRAADHAFLLKRAVRAAARAEGLLATFMAKPLPGQSGSGLHVHVSLLTADGDNLFARDEQALHHAIAGLQATMAESMLLWAPNANGYRRLRPLSYAPNAPTWGHNNRTVALRIPTSGPAARRIEHRVAGADANPYLVLAAVLAGIHHGLTHELEPDAPITGNAYAQVAPSLPLSWDRAIEALAGATILPGYLGEAFCRLYRVCRAAERDRFADVITPTEYAWYLHTL